MRRREVKKQKQGDKLEIIAECKGKISRREHNKKIEEEIKE